MHLRGKKILVVGLGRSGLAAARFLLSKGASVSVTDIRPETEMRAALGDLAKNVRGYFGGHPLAAFKGQDLVCLSPGVSPTLPSLQSARRRRIPIRGEMDLALDHINRPIVAVTGTNGKSTTATLIARMIESQGKKVALAGNIGKPLMEIVMEGCPYNWIVLEVSSFQLETMQEFRPGVAVILNITEDHLDRYANFRDYVRAKMRIVRDQSSRDFIVYNDEDRQIRTHLRTAAGHRIPFSYHHPPAEGLFYSSGRIVRRWKREFEEYPLQKVKLVGVHNVENMMAAVGAARAVGTTPEGIQGVLESFAGLPHRMEFVGEFAGVRYYDDSKGTNVDAVVKSVAGFPDRKVILIAGGRHKGGSYRPLREPVSGKVKRLFLIGEASRRIFQELKGCTEVSETGTLEKAVAEAMAAAQQGDSVLLSPACSSFDQFRDYAERGNRFQELVRENAQAV